MQKGVIELKIDDTVMEALDGKGYQDSIYAMFSIPSDTNIDIRPNLIFKLCAEKRVIHLGCTDHLSIIDQKINSGMYLHQQLSYIASECIGIDINKEAVAHIRKKGIKNVMLADITEPGIEIIEEGGWDWLLVPDVIEHIPNPVAFLRDIKNIYGRCFNGIIITTPNAYGAYSAGEASFSKEMINYDNCYHFTPYTLCKIVHMSGFRLNELFLCSYENPTERIRDKMELLVKYPLTRNTMVLTAY